jgi:hypothetical protein
MRVFDVHGNLTSSPETHASSSNDKTSVVNKME